MITQTISATLVFFRVFSGGREKEEVMLGSKNQEVNITGLVFTLKADYII